ncbi:CDP-diacylglycerol--glycerol-3-phosphate 3-phosphatidyltransferase [Cyphellophora attinorum]|uniref:CDP-diacylglycerol--glycerol-3-phosphate 3-phosphatidyltransferase n=1 Tax=Cyphellophora attinorum TaxID=1664694 RepID=A0A0N0NPB9_9EURO|nr:CDP-diacylglycerol--glycerol-3-phosphate 3-phosphatidyltransferase [Phialophora attinorum]KPI42359.1 CDP-diacylglycerol--glycerol-3-phosphate 3-phosphatidyltransferase [Phialophora attinorum]
MLARSAGPRLFRQCICQRSPNVPRIRVNGRRFSSSSAPSAHNATPSAHPLAGVASQIDSVAPRFEVEASQIDILDSPAAFYETLKTKIKGAKRRVYLSTLYIGKTEHELIQTIDEALSANPKLRVSVLTDALRGTREDPNPSCGTLLAPLVTKYGDRVTICMYHTPNLNGWRKKHMPKRINEGWGLQHMKLYGFDDEILLSGANLSDDYFTNRLDRYHLFKSKELTDFYQKIHEAICEISYDLIPSEQQPGGFELVSPQARGIPDPVWHPRQYTKYAKQLLEPLLQPKARQRMFPVEFGKDKTFVYPLAQFDILLGQPEKRTVLDFELATFTSTEKPTLERILTSFAEDPRLKPCSWTFTAGYFNIDPDICRLLLAAAPKDLSGAGHAPPSPPCTVITASPWANGFYGSKGVSGMLPAAYTLLSRRFLRDVAKEGKEGTVQLKEWRHGTVGEPEGMTYHAKGLWITLPPQPDAGNNLEEEVGPSVAVVGSSNYTKRSYSLDLEVGAVVVTSDDNLKRKLKQEITWLQEDASVTTQDDLAKVDRRVGLRVRLSLWLVEALGGAL